MAKRNVYLSLSFSSVPFEAVEKIMDAAEEVGAAFTIHIDDEIVAEPESEEANGDSLYSPTTTGHNLG